MISHFHLDHFGDLVPWLWGRCTDRASGATPPRLWLPPGGRPVLDGLGHAELWDAVFEVTEYADGEPFGAAGLTVIPHRVLHYSEPTWGMRVEDGGAVLAYSADTAPAPSVVELARDADVFLCESTLIGPDTEPRGHMHPDEAREIAREAGVRRLLLTHRSAEHRRTSSSGEGLEIEIESR